MQILSAPREVQSLIQQLRNSGDDIGFVPTMGALHEGHLSLCRAAKKENSKVVASIFVNPLQFGANEDLNKYPRPFERDCELLQAEGCDVLFAPTAQDMYPIGAQTTINVAGLDERWEGAIRPGHFAGVATVVAKLFHICGPHRAYFGEKDWQQLQIISAMTRDLNFPLEIKPVPTVRESDGLALSSRNAYLAPQERAVAPMLFQALQSGVALARNGERDVSTLLSKMQAVCNSEPLIETDYIAVVHAQTLEPLQTLNEAPARALIAAKIGATRLIDNVAIG